MLEPYIACNVSCELRAPIWSRGVLYMDHSGNSQNSLSYAQKQWGGVGGFFIYSKKFHNLFDKDAIPCYNGLVK